MDNSKSNSKKKPSKCYIKVIDDTLTDDYQKWEKRSNHAMAVLIGLFVCPLLAALVTPLFPKAGASIAGAFILSIAIYVVLCFFVMKKKPEKAKAVKHEDIEQPISKKDYDELKEILERFGSVTTSVCKGFVLNSKKMAALYTVPLYGIATNPRIHQRYFIRTNHDIELFTRKDKELIEKVFGYDERDDVIWFSRKNIVKATTVITTPVIKFSDKDGNKMCFAHTQYSVFHNHRELTLENGKCIIHIKDKRPNYENRRESEDADSRNSEEYYDDDI